MPEEQRGNYEQSYVDTTSEEPSQDLATPPENRLPMSTCLFSRRQFLCATVARLGTKSLLFAAAHLTCATTPARRLG